MYILSKQSEENGCQSLEPTFPGKFRSASIQRKIILASKSKMKSSRPKQENLQIEEKKELQISRPKHALVI